MGVETPSPVINDACRELNFTNEGGVGGTTRLLKNITGLWLVQECRRSWKQSGREFGYDELTHLASTAPPLASLIDPDDPSFQAPGDMPDAIRDFCRRTGQKPPPHEGAMVRCALEGIALKSRRVLQWLEQLVGRRIETIHVVGGGVQNRLLCQFTADACNRRVLAGPVEATALGNVLVQAMAAGSVASVAQAREVIRDSVEIAEFVPTGTAAWDEAYDRFVGLAG
jgi:rhamnulokinase